MADNKKTVEISEKTYDLIKKAYEKVKTGKEITFLGNPKTNLTLDEYIDVVLTEYCQTALNMSKFTDKLVDFTEILDSNSFEDFVSKLPNLSELFTKTSKKDSKNNKEKETTNDNNDKVKN